MKKRILSLALVLSLLLSLSACGEGTQAATMHLRKTVGTVGVSDDGGKEVSLRENLGLYSGYGVDTSSESYAWIDLDSVKLTKMDQGSEIAITKEGKHLEIEVKAGSLFFNVTEPLEDDESMNIRTSTMIIGIRGTCGWVTQDTAALLEGTVEVAAGEQSVTISAGEMAVMSADGTLEVVEFSDQDIPAFVQEEIQDLPPEETPEGPQDTDPSADLLAERDKNNPIRSTSYDADGAPNTLTEYTLDEEGRILRAVHSGLGEYSYTDFSDYIYDDQGHWLETRHYDETGNLLEQSTLLEDTAERREAVSTSIGLNYDIEGQVTGTFNVSTNRNVTLYDKDGRYIRTETFDQDGVLTEYTAPEYDERGRVIRENIYAADGTLILYGTNEYAD